MRIERALRPTPVQPVWIGSVEVAESLDKACRSGLIASAGLTAGILVHVAGATVGLSALLATSALTFRVLEYAGAASAPIVSIVRLRHRTATAA